MVVFTSCLTFTCIHHPCFRKRSKKGDTSHKYRQTAGPQRAATAGGDRERRPLLRERLRELLLMLDPGTAPGPRP